MKIDQNIMQQTFFTRCRVLTIVAGLVSILLTSCGTSNAPIENKNPETTDKLKVIQTSTIAATVREIPKFISANGTFAAEETTRVTSEVAGIIESVFVKEGDFVGAGSIIFKLSEKDARLRLEQAQANELQAQTQIRQAEANLRQTQAQIGLDKQGKFIADNVPTVREARFAVRSLESDLKLAQVNERRYANLLETGDTSKIIYDQKRNELEKAQSAVAEARERLTNAENTARGGNQAIEVARANLDNARAAFSIAKATTAIATKTVQDTTIRTPLSGFVSQRPSAKGEYVSPNTPIVTIVRTNPIKLQLNLPEAQAAEIRPGMTVSASVAAFAERRFAGQISAINPNVNENSRSLSVEAVIENGENLLRPGMFASAKIMQSGGEQAVFVPETALVRNKNTNSVGVYVIENETARFRVVETDENLLVENGEVRIISGVTADEKVAITNIEQLFDGARVSVKN